MSKSNSRLTPGPWKVEIREFANAAIVFDATGGVVHREALEPTGEAGANARAIAAVPDLIEALEEFLACGPNAGHNRDLITQVERALAKARGE